MAKTQNKKVSIESVDKLMRASGNTEVLEWYGLEVTVMRTLSLRSMMEFVDSVVRSCVADDSTGYLPEAKAFAIGINVLTRYANFNLPEDAAHKYDIVCRSGAVEFVESHIDHRQYEDILNAIDDKLDWILEDVAAGINRRINEALSALEELEGKFGNVFDGVNSEDISNLVKALSADTGLDTDKLVASYLKAKEYDEQH